VRGAGEFEGTAESLGVTDPAEGSFDCNEELIAGNPVPPVAVIKPWFPLIP